MEDKKCRCIGCQSTSHDKRADGQPGECITRYSDAPYLWERGICPACLSHARLKTTETKSGALPHKHYFGKGVSIDEIVDTIIALPDRGEKITEAAKRKLPPQKVFFGKGASIDEIALKIHEMSIAALAAKDEEEKK